MQYYPFDSRDKLYKPNFGAVAAETPLRLRLLLHNDARVHNAYLIMERDGEQPFEKWMQPGGYLGEYSFYECEITLNEGLYWYSFRYDSDYGTMLVTRTGESLGTVSAEGKKWQQTVYESNYATPDWLKGGIIYQIFPDRFCFSGEKKDNVPDDRFIQTDWSAQPAYLQNGEKRNLGNDYYCGDFKGVTAKLPYLKELGVNCIYFNPVFEAHSNHRYNTADYLKIDPLLGNEDNFKALCKAAKKLGIYVILDGVFSHTGHDSRYFNKEGRYSDKGAYQSYDSPYRGWFNFQQWPDKYSCWWGVPSLPETSENNQSFTKFITGDGGVLQYWMDCGIKGWRLDVADELPDEFIDNIRRAIKSKDPDAYLLGEVWEDATNKISYGYRRRFLRGRQLDSVMNYPLANGIIDFVLGGDAEQLLKVVMSILENYPTPAVHTLMNHIGSHDTARILTRLGTAENGDRAWQSGRFLNDCEKFLARRRLLCAAALQFTLPGVPSVYYGDEAGMEGFGDPFCRGAYPWGNEDKEILSFYKKLGAIRRECTAFKSGEFIPVSCSLGIFSFIRKSEQEKIFVAVNRWDGEDSIAIPEDFSDARVLLGEVCGDKAILPPCGAVILRK